MTQTAPSIPSTSTYPYRVGALFFRTLSEAENMVARCVQGGPDVPAPRVVDRVAEGEVVA